jgi:hypothetical protein
VVETSKEADMRATIISASCFAVLACGAVAMGAPPDTWEAHRRAGFPQEVARFAWPSDTGRYAGYYVGGGAVHSRRGDPPQAHEGTWGWDYVGGAFRRDVIPGWWHGRRYQGGVGRYQPEGPTLLPK